MITFNYNLFIFMLVLETLCGGILQISAGILYEGELKNDRYGIYDLAAGVLNLCIIGACLLL
jgi:hypothetical protein